MVNARNYQSALYENLRWVCCDLFAYLDFVTSCPAHNDPLPEFVASEFERAVDRLSSSQSPKQLRITISVCKFPSISTNFSVPYIFQYCHEFSLQCRIEVGQVELGLVGWDLSNLSH